jgi:hypothetical protein
MPCNSCGSIKSGKYLAEVGIHFPGKSLPKKSAAWQSSCIVAGYGNDEHGHGIHGDGSRPSTIISDSGHMEFHAAQFGQWELRDLTEGGVSLRAPLSSFPIRTFFKKRATAASSNYRGPV